MSNRIRNFSFVLIGVILGLLIFSYFLTNSVHSEETRVTTELPFKQAIALTDKSSEWYEQVLEDKSDDVDLASAETEVAFRQFPTKKVVATGYTAGYESTGKTEDHPHYGVTYSGLEVQRGELSTIAADPNVFPLGTVLYVPDYGYGIVTDIGGAIKGNKIDLYYDSVDEVFNEWGKREVDVYVIEEGNGQVTEADVAYWEQAVTSEAVAVTGERNE
ncbi:3D domain-containing protein [Alkalibacillus aidingensis]|uniref:3D domain-containing protein n=1 Tax=Alkalibacillus aidingensis TaxID=2747607 RepID=UPI0016616B1A|nr:3D domain-containing protein [Alkalibacillus aidingensis]